MFTSGVKRNYCINPSKFWSKKNLKSLKFTVDNLFFQYAGKGLLFGEVKKNIVQTDNMKISFLGNTSILANHQFRRIRSTHHLIFTCHKVIISNRSLNHLPTFSNLESSKSESPQTEFALVILANAHSWVDKKLFILKGEN